MSDWSRPRSDRQPGASLPSTGLPTEPVLPTTTPGPDVLSLVPAGLLVVGTHKPSPRLPARGGRDAGQLLKAVRSLEGKGTLPYPWREQGGCPVRKAERTREVARLRGSPA